MNKVYIFGAAILLVLISASVGFYLGRSNSKLATEQAESKTTAGTININPKFIPQTVTLQGQVSKVEGSNIFIKNEAGEEGSFPVSENVVTIYKFKSGSTEASASSDLSEIEIGKAGLIVLEVVDGEYRVLSISYPPVENLQ